MKKDKKDVLEGKTQTKGGVNSEPYNLHIVNRFIQYIDELIMSDEELVMNLLSEDYNIGLSTLKIKCNKYKELIKDIKEGFELRCLKCNSLDVNIDFEKDIFWCSKCNQEQGCLDYGRSNEGY